MNDEANNLIFDAQFNRVGTNLAIETSKQLVARTDDEEPHNMSSDNWEHALFESMKEEHKELTDLLAKVRDAVSAEDRTKKQVDDLMTRLCELVETHFSHEEQGGYLKEALERAPRLAIQAQSLLLQHESLLDDVAKLRLLVHSGVESPAWWIRIGSDFHKFASRLLNHEHAETKVVQGAYTDDIGVGD